MTDRKIFAFYGYKGSGKSAAAEVLGSSVYTRLSFAAPLKSMLLELGLTMEQVYGNQKETPSVLLGGKTPRWAMQALGTEWGRNCIDPDLWVRAWERRLEMSRLVVVDDLRFPNEFKVLKRLGATVIKIVRPGLNVDATHESEKYVDDEKAIRPDYVIQNGGTLDDFKTLVCEMLRRKGGE